LSQDHHDHHRLAQAEDNAVESIIDVLERPAAALAAGAHVGAADRAQAEASAHDSSIVQYTPGD
jgi:hypothetical protein